MNAAQTYVLISIVVLAIVAIILFFVRGKRFGGKMSKLGILGSFMVLAGVIFSDSRFIGYGLMVTGGILALIDIVRKLRKSPSV